jgi:hypothetical protein
LLALYIRICAGWQIPVVHTRDGEHTAQVINLKTVAGPQMAHMAKISAAFEIPVLTLTVPGLRAENFKILCAFNQLHHLGPP